jgi:hypothetical protein
VDWVNRLFGIGVGIGIGIDPRVFRYRYRRRRRTPIMVPCSWFQSNRVTRSNQDNRWLLNAFSGSESGSESESIFSPAFFDTDTDTDAEPRLLALTPGSIKTRKHGTTRIIVGFWVNRLFGIGVGIGIGIDPRFFRYRSRYRRRTPIIGPASGFNQNE